MSQILQSSSSSGAGEHLFLSEDLSDVTIFVKSGDSRWRFPAHRLVLSAQSPVFQRMLDDDFSEKNTGCITIQDINPKIFELLLRTVYKGKVFIETWRDGVNLLRAAHKYQMEPLVQYCTRHLENVINICNVCQIYNEACVYTLLSLKEKSLKLILDAGFIVLRSKSFENLSQEAVMDVIKNSNLNIDNELMVFEALQRWCTMECCRTGVPVTDTNISLKLTPFFKYICFDDMSDTEKSALPPTVLSTVRPNNLCRISHSIPESLIPFSQRFTFSLDQECLECVGDSLTCIRFSIDAARFIIGLKFIVMASDFPHHLHLMVVKESSGSHVNVYTLNLAAASWRDGLQIMERQQYTTQIMFRQPYHLDAQTVHAIYLTDRNQNIYVNKSKLCNASLLSDKGEVNISLHSECVWGVMGLLII